MEIRTLSPVTLDPNHPMPDGMGYRSTFLEAIDAVRSGELRSALWRPPYREQLIAECSDKNFALLCKVKTAIGGMIGEAGLYQNAPSVDRLFAQAKQELNLRYDPYGYRAEATFSIWFPSGYIHRFHTDAILLRNIKTIRALITLKGDGTLIPSVALAKRRKGSQGLSTQDLARYYPHASIYQVSTGDVVVWSEGFDHASPTVPVSSTERLTGILDVRLKYAPKL